MPDITISCPDGDFSAYLAAPVKAGTRLGDSAVEFRRPGFGIPPDRFEELREAVFKADLPAGHRVALSDLGWDENS